MGYDIGRKSRSIWVSVSVSDLNQNRSFGRTLVSHLYSEDFVSSSFILGPPAISREKISSDCLARFCPLCSPGSSGSGPACYYLLPMTMVTCNYRVCSYFSVRSNSDADMPCPSKIIFSRVEKVLCVSNILFWFKKVSFHN